jgi:organic radical activating enzyme
MKILRRAFLDKEMPADCDRCWAEERAGRTSKRMHTMQRLDSMVDHDSWDEEPKSLMFLDLKLGNICNLKCRICGSWSSSSYAAEEIGYQENKKNNFHYVMMQLGKWPRQEKQFWSDLEQHMAGLRYLEFTGGEPFLIQEHFDLLDKLVSKGYAGNIEIHYNTNGTVWPENAEQIWQHFRHVEIAFSIDDVGRRFEYQRSGARWDEVNTNLDSFRQMRDRNSNITLQVCTTVSAFNVLYLEDVASWIDQQGFDFVYWNMLHDGPQFCIANLPDSVKTLVRQRLGTAVFSGKNQPEIDRIIDFMCNSGVDRLDQLVESIRIVDQRREQRLADVMPELAAALGGIQYDPV